MVAWEADLPVGRGQPRGRVRPVLCPVEQHCHLFHLGPSVALHVWVLVVCPSLSQDCGGTRTQAWSPEPLKKGAGIWEHKGDVKPSCLLSAQGFCSWLTAIFRIK